MRQSDSAKISREEMADATMISHDCPEVFETFRALNHCLQPFTFFTDDCHGHIGSGTATVECMLTQVGFAT